MSRAGEEAARQPRCPGLYLDLRMLEPLHLDHTGAFLQILRFMRALPSATTDLEARHFAVHQESHSTRRTAQSLANMRSISSLNVEVLL